MFTGIISDFKKPNTSYINDFIGSNVFNLKVLASILFMFSTSIFPAITFSSLLQRETNNSIGIIEVLLSSCITGILYSILAGQPITIVGVTGPTSILAIAIYNMSKNWKIDFISFYGCSQLWSALMHLLLVAFNSCNLAKYISDFSCDIFGILIAFIFIESGIKDIIIGYNKDINIGLFEFILAIGVYITCKKLSEAKSWHILNDKWRELISDYGPTFAILLWTFIGNSNQNNDEFIVRKLEVPDTFSTTNNRPWLINLSLLPTWAIFASIFPGFIITVLFFFDHNISSLMAQPKYYHLIKPNTFHWDFLIVGLGVLLTGLLGIPPTCGLIPQSPLHSKSLVTFSRSKNQNHQNHQNETIQNDNDNNEPDHENNININIDMNIQNDNKQQQQQQQQQHYHEHHEHVEKVYEQRVSNLIQSSLMGIVCIPSILKLLHLIPQAILDGFFLYLGFTSFYHNECAQRLFLLCSEKQFYHFYPKYSIYNEIPQSFEPIETHKSSILLNKTNRITYSSIFKYTLIQYLCASTIFIIVQTSAEIIFPLLIGILVPIRMFILPRYFTDDELNILDVCHANIDDESDDENETNDKEKEKDYIIDQQNYKKNKIETQPIQIIEVKNVLRPFNN